MKKLIILFLLQTWHAYSHVNAIVPTINLGDFTTFVFLSEDRLPSAANLQKNLQKTWNLTMTATLPNNEEIQLSSPTTSFKITLHRTKMPSTDWSSYSGISWIWQNATAEIGKHTSYLKIEVSSTDTDVYAQQKLMTKVIATLLEQTSSIGILTESRYLVIESIYYQQIAKNLLNDELPVYLWVYFGMSADGNKNSGFTYGLKTFGMSEIEIVSSSRSMGEVQMVLYESAKNVLKNKTILRDGSKIGDDNLLSVIFSEGVFLKGGTIKILY